MSDIGLATWAQVHTVRCALEAAQKVGFPEARVLIANVVVDLVYLPSRIRLIWLWMLPWQTLENQNFILFLVI